MEVMQRVAKKHGMICLLHEKPFANVSGSGKHNNWSIQTNTGVNLFKPGDTPAENAQFLLFLCAVIQAVDNYADLLRLSVASPSNDHRLGSHEAPPAVVSIFLGTELEEILDAIERDVPYNAQAQEPLRLGVHTLPKLPRDNTDRNRTSPFAFTGNKFEFRMLGSSDSIACTNIMLNTAVAESLRLYADELEAAEDFDTALHALIRRTVSEHKRIIFSGNGYDEAWVKEATEVRGLPNFPSTPDCVPELTAEKNLALFAQHKIYTPVEAASRRDVILDNYCKVIRIEALTMIDMVRRDILPAISKFTGKLAESGKIKREFCPSADTEYESKTVERLSALATEIMKQTDRLDRDVEELFTNASDIVAIAKEYRTRVFAGMEKLRGFVDEAETLTDTAAWPYPTYGDLMFSVK
jgi:glutamine synthetase